MWTLAFEHHEDRTPTQGYEATREAAMAGECALDAQDPVLRDIRQPRDLSPRLDGEHGATIPRVHGGPPIGYRDGQG
jgi:hypothetical protein